MATIAIIGSGFAGLSAACVLAQKGNSVYVFEKNSSLGGRARKFEADGFTFDMGPSWYWMPEVFENFYKLFGYTTSDFYDLQRLDPSYEVIFSKNESILMPADYDKLLILFESIESGSSKNLETFLENAKFKYEVGMNEFVWKPSYSIAEYLEFRLLKSAIKLKLFNSISAEIDKLFNNEKLRKILKFPVLFLGATPENTPSLYSLMNYADLKLGTWYPHGGMSKIVDAFVKIATDNGVKFSVDEPVLKINIKNNKANSITTTKRDFDFDYIISGADYQHVDQQLLKGPYQNYNSKYWNSRVLAPSSLLYYLGIDIDLTGLTHHSLFFDKEFELHANEIYKSPKWPTDPLFYMCCPSVTDKSVAPVNNTNIFLLMPIAPDIEDNENIREEYFKRMCKRIYELKGIDIIPHIIFKKSYCLNDFITDYNSFKGNAYGLANTLKQTAILKPSMKHKKIDNIYFTGQLTIPGPGVPPSIISGQVVANEVLKQIGK